MSFESPQSTSAFREPDIKAALIDYLFERGRLKNSVLINEMVIANWSRRVDLVVANGTLNAFEIKSDFDSLRRLDGQLDAYLARFDKVTVVCAPKFTRAVIEKTPPSVEVLESLATKNKFAFKLVRRGVSHPVTNKHILLGYLLKTELLDLLRSNDVIVSTNLDRRAMEDAALVLSLRVIRTFVLEAIKLRYTQTSSAFLNARMDQLVTRRHHLRFLRKVRAPSPAAEHQEVPYDLRNLRPAFEVNWDAILRKYNCDPPDDMPGLVYKRKRTNAV
jgi:hypothetical protein